MSRDGEAEVDIHDYWPRRNVQIEWSRPAVIA